MSRSFVRAWPTCRSRSRRSVSSTANGRDWNIAASPSRPWPARAVSRKPPGCCSRASCPRQRQLADFDHQLRHHRRIKYKLNDLIKCLPETGHPMDALQAGVAAMGMFYPARDVHNEQSNWDSVVRLIAKLPTIVAAFHRLRHGDEPITPRDDLDHAANFYYMLFEQEPSPAVRQGARRLPDPARRAHHERLDVQRPRHRLDAGQSLHGHQLRHRHADRPAARRRQRGSAGHARGDRHGRQRPTPGSTTPSPTRRRSWASAIASTRSRTRAPRSCKSWPRHVFVETGRPKLYELALEMERVAAGILGPKGIYPNVDFYSGIVYLSARHPARSVHADLRHRPRRRLAVALAGAAEEQPHLPPGADLRRQT